MILYYNFIIIFHHLILGTINRKLIKISVHIENPNCMFPKYAVFLCVFGLLCHVFILVLLAMYILMILDYIRICNILLEPNEAFDFLHKNNNNHYKLNKWKSCCNFQKRFEVICHFICNFNYSDSEKKKKSLKKFTFSIKLKLT